MDSSIQATTLIIQSLSQLGSLSAGGYSGSAGGAFDPQYIEASLNTVFSKNISQDASIVILRAKDVTIDSSLASIININFSQDASIVAVQNANTSRDASIVDLRNKNTSQDASIVRIDSSINNILTGTTTFSGTKTFSNQIISNNGMKSSDYVPGPLGSGYCIGADAEFVNLSVNGNLDVYSLTNNILTATNGTFIVTSSVTAIDTSTEGAGINKDASGYYFNVEPWGNSMQTGYAIRSQSSTVGEGIEQLNYTVVGVNGGKVYVDINEEDEIPNVKGKEFVRINGNNIILTSDMDNNPYIQVNEDVSGFVITNDNTKVRIGRLEGINFNDSSLSGTGFYSDNVYLKGNIVADEAYIQSGRIGENGLYITSNGINSGTDGQERFELNAPNQTTGTGGGIYFYDGSTNNNLSIHTNRPIDIYKLKQSSSYTISGTNASASTTVTQASAIATYTGPDKYLSFKQQPHVSLTSGSVIPNDASAISTMLGLESVYYFKSIHNISYTIPSNYTEYPAPNIRIEHTYTASGTWEVRTSGPKAYNISDEDVTYQNHSNQGRTNEYNEYSSIDSYSAFVSVAGDDPSIYMKYNYAYKNNISIKEQVIIYDNDIVVYSYNNYTTPTITFNSAIYTFDYVTQYQQITEITNRSILNYVTPDLFFKWNIFDVKELEIAANWVDVSSNITTHGSITTNGSITTYGDVGITGDITVSGKIKPKGVEYDDTYSTSTSYTLDNEEACYIFNGSSNGTVYLPSSPLSGQQHIIINRTTSYTVTINGNGKNLYDSGSSYTTRPCGNRQSWTLIYNGAAWSTVAYR